MLATAIEIRVLSIHYWKNYKTATVDWKICEVVMKGSSMSGLPNDNSNDSVRIPTLPQFKCGLDLERGPPSFARTIA